MGFHVVIQVRRSSHLSIPRRASLLRVVYDSRLSGSLSSGSDRVTVELFKVASLVELTEIAGSRVRDACQKLLVTEGLDEAFIERSTCRGTLSCLTGSDFLPGGGFPQHYTPADPD